MSKKMMKRSLTIGALMAFVITGQAWAAQVVDQNLIVNQNETIPTDSFNDGTFGTGNRTVALGYTTGNDNTVTIGADTTLKLVNEYANAYRSYGIVVHNPVNGASLDISGGVNSVVDLDVKVANRAHGVRNNYNGTLNINVGLLDVNVKMTGDSDVTYGMDVWQGSTTNINTDTKGTTTFYVEAAKGSVYGIQGWNDGGVYSNADGQEVPYSNKNAVVNINDLDLTVKSTHQNSNQTERDKQGAIVLRGINLHETNMNLVGDTTKITLTNDGKYLRSAIVALQGNHSDAPTVLNFNAATTTLKATGGEGNNSVVGVSASGGSSQINFNGDSVLVDIDGGNANVIGVNAQYKGNTVSGLEKTSIKVDVESKTDEKVFGIGSFIYDDDSAGNIDFAGDTTVMAKNNGSGSALGVYAEYGGNVTLDGDDVYVDVSGASNDMSGVYVRNETRKSDKQLGESKVILGNAGSNVTVKVNSTNGDVQGLWASKYTATGHNNEYNSLQDTKAAVINVKGKDVLIDVATTGSGNASAVFAASKTENGVTQEANKSKISIEADNTTINVKAASGVAEAIIAHSDSVVDITKGNLYVTANDGKGYVVSTRGNADVKLGCAGKETQLNGDILFDYASNGGKNIDSKVDVTLDGVNSWFTGKIIKDKEIPADANSDVTGMNLALSKGATWNVTGDSFVNTLAGNGGNLVKAEGVGDVTVTVYNHNENQKDDNDNDNVIEGFSGVAFANNNLKITDVNLVVDTWETSIYNNNIKIDSNSDVTIKSGKDDGICAYGNVEIKAQNVTIEAFDNGIKAGPDGENNDGKAQIAEGNVDIIATNAVNISSKVNKELRPDDATGEGYAITNVSTSEKVINVTGETVTLSSDNKTAVKAGHINGQNIFNGTINVTGTKTINIDGYAVVDNDGDEEKEYEDSVVSAQGKGVLNLSAPTITITDNAEAGGNSIGAYDGGTVNIKDATKVELDSKIFANGEGSKIRFANVGNLELTANGSEIHGINAENGATVELTKAHLKITANNVDGETRACAIDVSRKGVVESTDEVTTMINGGEWAAGVEATHEGRVTLEKAELTVNNATVVGSEAYGINVARKGTATVNGNLTATITGGEWVSGVEAYNGSSISVGNSNSEANLTVSANSATSSDEEWGVRAHGIFAAGQSNPAADDDGVAEGGSTININAGDLTVKATANHGQAFGIYAQDEGNVKATGAVSVTANGYSAYGVEALAGSTVELGASDKDVAFNITSTGTEKAEAQAITAEGGSIVTVNANKLGITTTATSGVVGSLQVRDEGSEITVNANDVNLKGDMWAGEGAKVTVNATTFAVAGSVGSAGEIDITGSANYDANTQFYTEGTGAINLAGGNVTGVLNVVGGNVNLTGATFTATNLKEAITGDGKLVVKDNGVLKTTADQVFTVADKDTVVTDKAAFTENAIKDNVEGKVTFESGALSLSDDYSYEYLTSITKVMKEHKYNGTDNSQTKLVMTGTLVHADKVDPNEIKTENGKLDVEDASNLGSGVHLDQVTIEAEKNLIIGAEIAAGETVEVNVGDAKIEVQDSVAKGFSANKLELSDGSDGAVITGGQIVTLGGSDGCDDIVTVDNSDKAVQLIVGTNGHDEIGDDNHKHHGEFNVGVENIDHSKTEYKLNGSVHVNEGSKLNTNGKTEITKGVELEGGELNVHEDGHLEADIDAKGNSKITGKVKGNLKAEDPSTMIHLGNDKKAGKMKSDKSELKGATLFLDPFYADGMPSGSEFALKDAANLDGAYIAGQNSTISFGVDELETAHAVFAETELTFGSGTQNGNTVNGDVNAVVYIADSVSLNNAAGNLAGSITANGALTSAPTATPGKVIFADKSLLMVEAEKVANKAAISGVTATDVSDKAKLYINNAQKDGEYKILAGSSISTVWTDDNITTNNKLIVFEGSATGNAFDVKAVSQSVNDVYGDDVIIGEVVDESIANGGSSSDIFNSAANEDINVDRNAQVDALNSIGAMNEVAGVTHTTYAVSNILTDAVADHMSLANGKDHDKDVWAHYVHTKENVDGLKRAGAYDAQYNGVVVGADLYNEGKATVGAALTYVDGNINGSSVAARTENDAKYYGASVYGSIQNDDTAVIADVSYLHGEHDITQRNSGKVITGEPESDAFSVGVRVEKEAKAGIGKLVPYAGLRYMHLGTGNYTNSIGLAYDADDAELFLLPVGLKYSADIKNTNGWTMRPVVEFGYVWAFGDTDADQTVSLNGASNGFGYDVTDSGSYVGRFVLEAEKANISYALGYEYQKGDDVKADKWMVNVNWKF